MISFCIIGKNEEAVLDKCLTALAPYGCEIVFVDTGSSDGTREIALRYTDKVYDFPWVDDFSAARNFSIGKASCEYILPIDCDEIVTAFDRAETERLIARHPGAVGRVTRINVFTRGGEAFDEREPVSRLFSRELYRYEGAIHEQLVRKDGSAASYYQIPLTMLHSGYEGKLSVRRRKTQRNRDMLLRELAAHPEDTYLLYQLGKTYYMEQDYRQAGLYFGQALEYDLDPALEYVQNCVEAYGYCLIETEEYERALGLEGVYDAFAVSSDFVFLMGLVYMYNGLFDRAVEEFLKATTMKHVKVAGTDSYRAYYNVGVIYECLGDIGNAKKYYTLSGDFAPAKERLKSC